MPPLVSIVGESSVGKTTLLEKLVRELKSRGYRVATIKHSAHDVILDRPDKDSWRHILAGSEATAISSPKGIVLVKPTGSEISIEEIGRLLGEDYDLIITEGFKQGSAPKIEVHRREAGPPLSTVKKIIAIVTDEPLATTTRQFALEDIKGLADFLEESFIEPQRERASLYINNTAIPLSSFPREFIASVMLGMLSALKGVGKVHSLDFSLRKKRD
ncbi:molybdopterin-guanine dinucleotide biosynthesis protein B [Chloroflexota bacterium]